eukprot:7960913-Pyramimonas_sp.AAC.1
MVDLHDFDRSSSPLAFPFLGTRSVRDALIGDRVGIFSFERLSLGLVAPAAAGSPPGRCCTRSGRVRSLGSCAGVPRTADRPRPLYHPARSDHPPRPPL